MAATLPTQSLSYAEYLALERETDTRYEYLDGEVWMMSGGTPRHSRIKFNLVLALGNALRGSPCQGYDSDLKIRVLATGLATYPDLTIVCGGQETHPEDRNALTNPTVLFEVVSRSTEGWDRGGKFQHAQQITSLRHYVLVSQDTARVELFTRSDVDWRYTSHGAGEQVTLASVGVTLAVDDLYRDLPAAEDAPA